MKTIRIPQGNEFSLFVPLVLKDGTAVEGERLSDIEVLLQSAPPRQSYAVSVNVQSNYVVVTPQVELPLGSYDLTITAKYENRDIAILLNNCFAISTWTNGSDYEKYLVGKEIVLEQQVLIGAFNTDAELETLKEQYRTAIAALQAAQAEAEAAKDAFNEKAEQLEGVARETTSQEIKRDVADVKTAVENIDFSELAKQGTNTAATNSVILADIRSRVAQESNATANKNAILAAIPSVADVQDGLATEAAATGNKEEILEAVSVSPIGLESELQTGKQAIAEAIVRKGVEAEGTDTLAELADKIGEITTQEITIDGGEMYPENMWGDYLHDLFKVATEVRNNGLYDSYAGFIVGQMYKGYATFDLSTIQADAYLTSDGDFYTTAQTHTWHDDEDGYADRYIVFFYTNENYSFRTTISGVCPRQIVVVGKCAKIYIDYNRLTRLYVFTELGGELGNFSVGSNTPQGNWMFVQNIRGYKNHDSGYFFHNASQLGFVSFADLKVFSGGGLFHASSANSMFSSMISAIFPELETIDGGVLFDATANSYTNISEVAFPKLKNIFRGYLFVPASSTFTNVSSLEFPNLEKCSGYIIDTRSGVGNSFANLRLISFPKLSSILGGCLFQMYNSNNMYQHVKTLEFPSLTEISGGRVVSGYGANIFTEITAINFPHLSSLYNGVILSMTANGGTQNAYNNLVSINLPELETISGNSYIFGQEVYYSGHTNNANSLISINLNCVKRVVDTARILRCETTNSEVISLEEISLPSIEEYSSSETNKIPINFKRLYLGYVENDRTKSVAPRFSPLTRITDIELKNGYLKPVRLDLTSTVLTAENIALHILDRLGDNIGNATLTCTIGSANLNRILADGTYASYVAAAQAKNWTIN